MFSLGPNLFHQPPPSNGPLVLRPIPVPERAQEPASLPRIEEPEEEAAPSAIPGLPQLKFEPIPSSPVTPPPSSPEEPESIFPEITLPIIPGLPPLPDLLSTPLPPEPARPIKTSKKYDREKRLASLENRKRWTKEEITDFLKLKKEFGTDYKKISRFIKKDVSSLKTLDSLYRQGFIKLKNYE